MRNKKKEDLWNIRWDLQCVRLRLFETLHEHGLPEDSEVLKCFDVAVDHVEEELHKLAEE